MIPRRVNEAWVERAFWGIIAVSFLVLVVVLVVLVMDGRMVLSREPVRREPESIAVPPRPIAPPPRAAPDAPADALPPRAAPGAPADALPPRAAPGAPADALPPRAAPDAPATPGGSSWSDLDPAPDMALRAALLDAWQCARQRNGYPPLVADPMLDMQAFELFAAWQRAGAGGAGMPLPPGIAEALLASMPPETVPACADPWPDALPAPPSAAARRVGLVVVTPRADVLLHERVVTVVMIAQEDHP